MRIKCPTMLKVPKISNLILAKTFVSFSNATVSKRCVYQWMHWNTCCSSSELYWSSFGTLLPKNILWNGFFPFEMLVFYLVRAFNWTEGSLEMSLKQSFLRAQQELQYSKRKNCKYFSSAKRNANKMHCLSNREEIQFNSNE